MVLPSEPELSSAQRKSAHIARAFVTPANVFCSLGIEAWLVALGIVDITTLFSCWDAFKATIQTAGDCAAFYAYLAERERVGEASLVSSSSNCNDSKRNSHVTSLLEWAWPLVLRSDFQESILNKILHTCGKVGKKSN
ncbi:hypothetical protein JVT61DRAFT_3738 [Boletus reticuloceps]|uniref:Uncharacterized protein n=1 Tax=Boletus reticuloceps TaxID=495285 RepID=A0A8I2YN74_9AGAM|nr:hypothetical protein JVT61DRAFT_3738 [Boletus reticuloceps]